MKRIIAPRIACVLSLMLSLSAYLQAGEYAPDRAKYVRAYMYNMDDATLTIFFANNVKVKYRHVPEAIYEGLKNAPLKHGYYIGLIRGAFEVVDD